MVSTLSEYARRKQKMHEYLGGSCSICNSTKELHIDHINPEEKSFDVSAKWGISWGRLKVELDKCQLLCKEHHTEKSSNEGSQSLNGNKNGSAKLSWEQVREIRNKYVPYVYTGNQLTVEYNVSRTTIKEILANRSWKE